MDIQIRKHNLDAQIWLYQGIRQLTGLHLYFHPDYADMTELYSSSQWVDLPFSDQEISADPNYMLLQLVE